MPNRIINTRQQRPLIILTLIGGFILTVLFIIIPQFQPRDDGLSYLLPNIIVQGRILFETLSIPQINFYQFLGHPLLPQSQSGVFYLPHYFFYIVGEAVHNYDAGAGLEYCFHILLASMTMYLFLGIFTQNILLRILGSLSYAFSGMNMVLGHNWPIVTIYLAYYPLLLYYLERYKLTSAFITYAILLSIGHTQFFFIVALPATLYFFMRHHSFSAIKGYFGHTLLFVVLALPILLPMFSGYLESSRLSGQSFDPYFLSLLPIFYILTGFGTLPLTAVNSSIGISQVRLGFVPIGLVLFNPIILLAIILITQNLTAAKQLLKERLVPQLSNSNKFLIVYFLASIVIYGAHLYLGANHLDSIFITTFEIFTIYAFIEWLTRRTTTYILLTIYSLIVCLTAGPQSFYTLLILPFYSAFRWPFKWYLGAAPFVTIIPILFIARLKPKFTQLTIVTPLLIALLTVTYISNSTSLTINPLFTSYRNLQTEILASIDKNQRIAPVGSAESLTEGDLSRLLTTNIASYAQLLSLTGYDPLLPIDKASAIGIRQRDLISSDEYFLLRLDFLRAYGVSQYLYLNDSSYFPTIFKDNPDFSHIVTSDRISLYSDSKADPIASQNQNSVPFQTKGNSIYVQTKSLTEPSVLTLAFMKSNDNWVARTGNTPLKFQSDPYQRISVVVPPNTSHITVTYREKSFYTGMTVSGSFALLISGYLLITRKKDPLLVKITQRIRHLKQP